MSWPDIELIRKKTDTPPVITMAEGQTRLFINKAVYDSFKTPDGQTDFPARLRYLNAIDDYFDTMVSSEQNKNGVWTPGEKEENFRLVVGLLNDDDWTHAGVATRYVNGFATISDENKDGVPDKTGVLYFNSNITIEDALDERIIGTENLNPKQIALRNEVFQNFVFEHEKAHMMRGRIEPGSDYIAAIETLRKYGDGPEVLAVLDIMADTRILNACAGRPDRDAVSAYGAESAQAIRDAIQHYRLEKSLNRPFSYQASSKISNWHSSLAGLYPSAADQYERKVRSDESKVSAYYDRLQRNALPRYDRLPAGDSRDLIDVLLKERLKLPDIRKYILKDTRDVTEDLPENFLDLTPEERAQHFQDNIDRLFEIMTPEERDSLLEDAILNRQVFAGDFYPEITVRHMLADMLREDIVRDRIGVKSDQMDADVDVIYRRLSFDQLQHLAKMARDTNVFKDALPQVKETFQLFQQSLEQVRGRNAPVLMPDEKLQPPQANSQLSMGALS